MNTVCQPKSYTSTFLRNMRFHQPSALGTSDLRDASAGVLHAKDALRATPLTLEIQDSLLPSHAPSPASSTPAPLSNQSVLQLHKPAKLLLLEAPLCLEKGTQGWPAIQGGFQGELSQSRHKCWFPEQGVLENSDSFACAGLLCVPR